MSFLAYVIAAGKGRLLEHELIGKMDQTLFVFFVHESLLLSIQQAAFIYAIPRIAAAAPNNAATALQIAAFLLRRDASARAACTP